MSRYYKQIFERVLSEFQKPDITRNPDAIQYQDDTDPKDFDVDPMSANVGFKSNNMERDVRELKSTIEDLNSISNQMKKLSEKIAALERSFDGIGKVSKTIAAINQKVRDLSGEIEGYIISLPSQKNDQEEDSQPDIVPQGQGEF